MTLIMIAIFSVFFSATAYPAYTKTVIEYFSGKTDQSASIGKTLSWHTSWPGANGPITKAESECYLSITTHFYQNNSKMVWIASNFFNSLGVNNFGTETNGKYWKGWDGNLNSAIVNFDENTKLPVSFINKKKFDDGSMGGNNNIVFQRKCQDLKFFERIER